MMPGIEVRDRRVARRDHARCARASRSRRPGRPSGRRARGPGRSRARPCRAAASRPAAVRKPCAQPSGITRRRRLAAESSIAAWRAEGRRVRAQVEHHVVQGALQAGDDLGLGARADLIVQPAQGAGPLGEGEVGLLDPGGRCPRPPAPRGRSSGRRSRAGPAAARPARTSMPGRGREIRRIRGTPQPFQGAAPASHRPCTTSRSRSVSTQDQKPPCW